MAHTFNCPNCGAPLDYGGDDPLIRCPYCHSSVIVPENLRARPRFSSKQDDFTMNLPSDLSGLLKQAQQIYQVKRLAEQGETESAIALYREITGAEEFAARQAVNKLAAGQPVVFEDTLILNSPPPTVASVPSRRTTSKTGRWVGCFFVSLVVFILASVLLPIATRFGLVTLGGGAGLEQPGGVEVPFDLGYLLRGWGFATRELSFGGEGTGPGLFEDVRAIGVHPVNGNIYAAGFSDGRIQAFDAQGKFITQWMIPREQTDPYFDDMVVGRDGTIYLAVYGKLHRFDSKGQPLGTFELGRDYVENLDITADGTLVVIANGEDILWISRDGEILKRVDDAVSSVSGDSELSAMLAVDGLGNVFVLGAFNRAVFVFDANGKFLNRFGKDGDEPGQFRAPLAIEVDNKGRVFVSDIKGIQVFSNDGRYLDVLKLFSAGYGLAFDDQNNLYVTTGEQKIHKFSIKD